ncbi:hypothetical protein BO70DRAFT_41548 [Aspergillus heteromorphus CBS 117.55]|uniref:Proteinase inhibitor I78 n=1 Tax=Aspergillus heteromorphus CBS 117.55 TaxID=1448321 RepID=A0A317W842_9EURO|nr:uncharacterized protein BO70DRAFT_41548 [Aspergillus heteromorphus CBS 117.55]PWY81881.1 hypothetical protein BO70DRAFT_41548 [Aspergillus heteromorphus CBS 117.55]
MPLVVPGINNTEGSSQDEWLNKLAGKTISEQGGGDATSFAKQDLPKSHRIVRPGQPVTRDWNPERLNVHVSEEGTVQHVSFG